jgi:hypothetical protein
MNAITLVDLSPGYKLDRRIGRSCLIPATIAECRGLPDRRILNCLQALNLTIHHLPRREFMQRRYGDKSILTLFICDKSVLLDGEFLLQLQHFQSQHSPINLCILSTDSVFETERLPEFFDDFIYWPCACRIEIAVGCASQKNQNEST